MKSFTNLQAWQTSLDLVREIYSLTKSFPSDERFVLVSQLRRASTSILANIAEGFSRSSDKDKAYKYTIARGECAEVHALLLVSVALGRLTEDSANSGISLSLQSGKLLSGLIQRFSKPQPQPYP